MPHTYSRSLLVLASGFSLGLVLTSPATAASAIPAPIAAAITDAARAPTDFPRDKNRKPADMLAFANVKPGQHVVDFMPGRGYYTRLLSKTVGAKGKVYAVVPMDRRGDFEPPRRRVERSCRGRDSVVWAAGW